MKRWAIYIDIEGFSSLYANNMVQAIKGLGTVMKGIYFVGTKVCPESPNRLFVHQTGDGFVIVSEFGQGRPQLPVAIAIILMRCALRAGCLTKAGISEGEFADIRGCYPEVITRNSDADGRVDLGSGLMRVFPVMGTALINAHHLTTRKKGALLLLDAPMASDLISNSNLSAKFPDFVAIDWVHADLPEIRHVATRASIRLPEVGMLEELLKEKVEAAKGSVPKEWVKNTLTLNRLGCTDHGNKVQ